MAAVIRPVGVDQYRVQVVTKAGVPPFPPVLSQELSITEETVGQIFTKLIHAEQASYKTGMLWSKCVVLMLAWCRQAGGAEGELQTVRASAAAAPAAAVRGRSQ